MTRSGAVSSEGEGRSRRIGPVPSRRAPANLPVSSSAPLRSRADLSRHSVARRRALLPLALTAAAGCGSSTVDPELDYIVNHKPAADSAAHPAAPAAAAPARPAAMTLTRHDTTLTVGVTVGVEAVIVDSAGHVLYDQPVAWTSSDSTVARVSASGDVTARKAGEATIAATNGALRQVLRVRVVPVPPPTVAAVTFAPYTAVIALGDSVRLAARAEGEQGQALTIAGRAVTWALDADVAAPLSLSAKGTPADSSVRWAHAINVGIGRVAVVVDGVGTVATIRVAGPVPPTTPRVSRITVTLGVPQLDVGESTVVMATALDASGQVVTTAPMRITSVNPASGRVTQDSVGTGPRAGIAYGTLQSFAPGIFSIVGETLDGRVYGQAVVVIRVAPSSARALP